MLRSLIAQLSYMAARFPPEVNEPYDRFKGRRSQPSHDELVSILVKVATLSSSKVYIVLDAIDECNERDVLLPILESLIVSKTISILFSSRRERDITEMVSSAKPINVPIEADRVAGDVGIFLENRMKIEPFRWVKCQLDLIKSFKRPKSIRYAIGTLPGTLDGTYERILCSVTGDEERNIVRQLLQLIIFSARPMTINEVAEAVVIDVEGTKLDEEARFTYSSDVVSGYQSLFTITGNHIGLAHYSIQGYLTSDRIRGSAAKFLSIQKDQCKEELCARCLTYITYDDFCIGPCSSQEDFELRLERYPFLDYACNHWFSYCESEKVQEKISARYESIWLNRYHPKYLSWAQVFSDKSITPKRDFKSYTLLTPSLIYYPALWGLAYLCGRIIHLDPETINQEGGYYGTALQAAAVYKRTNVIKVLVENGADVNQQGGYFGNALQAAAVVGDYNNALYLIRNGALVHTQVGIYGTSLQGAARNGHLDVIQLVLHYGADVNQQCGPYGTALQAAANNGHIEIVQCLIENGGGVNANSGAFGTALEGACAAAVDHNAVVRLLLRNSGDSLTF
ncbi:ankyrin repeat-containing domain protein [Nemania abortiva]|nr:ankyrin repeat-containing domain protein [Nemania abortiva]